MWKTLKVNVHMQTWKVAMEFQEGDIDFVWTCNRDTHEKTAANEVGQTDEPRHREKNVNGTSVNERGKKVDVARKRTKRKVLWSDSKKHRPYAARNEIYRCAGLRWKMLISHVCAMQTHPRCSVQAFFSPSLVFIFMNSLSFGSLALAHSKVSAHSLLLHCSQRALSFAHFYAFNIIHFNLMLSTFSG